MPKVVTFSDPTNAWYTVGDSTQLQVAAAHVNTSPAGELSMKPVAQLLVDFALFYA